MCMESEQEAALTLTTSKGLFNRGPMQAAANPELADCTGVSSLPSPSCASAIPGGHGQRRLARCIQALTSYAAFSKARSFRCRHSRACPTSACRTPPCPRTATFGCCPGGWWWLWRRSTEQGRPPREPLSKPCAQDPAKSGQAEHNKMSFVGRKWRQGGRHAANEHAHSHRPQTTPRSRDQTNPSRLHLTVEPPGSMRPTHSVLQQCLVRPPLLLQARLDHLEGRHHQQRL